MKRYKLFKGYSVGSTGNQLEETEKEINEKIQQWVTDEKIQDYQIINASHTDTQSSSGRSFIILVHVAY